jgi:hypothetical protein
LPRPTIGRALPVDKSVELGALFDGGADASANRIDERANVCVCRQLARKLQGDVDLAKHFAKRAHFSGEAIHETDWAYCPSNVRTDGHDWKPPAACRWAT